MALRVPLEWEGEHVLHRVRAGQSLQEIAAELESEPWRIIRDNGLLWTEWVAEGMTLRMRSVPKRPTFVVHRVSRGENLTMIARRYGTSVNSIQEANAMGRRTLIKIGERLRIPTLAE